MVTTTDLAPAPKRVNGALAQRGESGEIMERVITVGDLQLLEPAERVQYYNAVCHSIGLNPLSRPFEYLRLNGKLILYARKDATDQLRAIKGVSILSIEPRTVGDLYTVTAHAKTAEGRADEDMGAVSIAGLRGEALANAMMKATTKAKRRVTLSICGLGFLDESELDGIPAQARRKVRVNGTTGEIEGEEPAEPTPQMSAPDLSEDADFLMVWDNACEGKGLDHQTGRALLGAICRKRKIDFATSDVPTRQQLINDLKGKSADDLAKLRGGQQPASAGTAPEPAPAPQADSPAAGAGDSEPDTAADAEAPTVALDAAEQWVEFADNAFALAKESKPDQAAFNAALRAELTEAGMSGREIETTPAWRETVMNRIRKRRGHWTYLGK